MKNYIITFTILTLVLCLFSCSKDDENAQPQIPEHEKLVDEIILGEGSMTLTYNADKTVESVNIQSIYLFLFSYTANQISTIEFVGDGQSQIYTFEYNDNGRISSFTTDGEVTPVVWNEANRYYLYQKENADEVGIFLNEYEDVKKTTFYDDSEDETVNFTFFYDETHKGPMTNSNQILVPMYVAIPGILEFFYISLLSKQPLEMMASPIGIITYENTFDGQGFVSTANGSIGADAAQLTYNYTQLNN